MMGLEDFDKIKKNENVENEKKVYENLIIPIDWNNINYYLHHMDELISIVEESYREYIDSKLKYEFKKSELQLSIRWDEENALRKANDLPKISNQTQKDALIELKIKNLKIHSKSYEHRYKFYKKIFDFISNNFELLLNFSKFDCNVENES